MPPWCLRSDTWSPSIPSARTTTGPWTGCLSMEVRPISAHAASRVVPTLTERTEAMTPVFPAEPSVLNRFRDGDAARDLVGIGRSTEHGTDDHPVARPLLVELRRIDHR